MGKINSFMFGRTMRNPEKAWNITVARGIVVERSDGYCEICRKPGTDFQHRRARSAGGSKASDTNSPANLILLCRPCHHDIENVNRQRAYDMGWALKQGTDPLTEPVFLLGDWVLIDNIGAYLPYPRDYVEG